MNEKKLIKDIKRLEKKKKKTLKAIIISFLSEFSNLNDLALNLNNLSWDIKEEVYSINSEGITLANKYSDINNKPKKDKKEGLIIMAAALNLARKAAGYTLSENNYGDGVKEAKKRLDSDIEMLVVTQLFTNVNKQLINNNLNALFRWDAQMDIRTCPVCASYNGNQYTASEAPPCPAHPRCRCILFPIS